MSQDLVLNVTVPAECEIGSVINVLFEGKYYQVTVPEGAPGKTIEVTVPASEQQASQQASSGDSAADSPAASGGGGGGAEASLDTKVEETQVAKPSKYALGGAAIGTIGLFILSPIIGCITVIGVAAAAYYNTKNDPNLSVIQPYIKTAVEATGAAMQYVDDKTGIGQKVSDSTAGLRAKISEFDEKHKIYENTAAVVSPIANKTREILEATPGKIVQVSQYTWDKAAELNETYQVSNKVGSAIGYSMSVLEQVPGALNKATTGLFGGKKDGPATPSAASAPVEASSSTDASSVDLSVASVNLTCSADASDGQTPKDSSGSGAVESVTPVTYDRN